MSNPKQPKAPPASQEEEASRLVAFVPKRFHHDLRVESVQRGLTLGELIIEAFMSRTMKVNKS